MVDAQRMLSAVSGLLHTASGFIAPDPGDVGSDTYDTYADADSAVTFPVVNSEGRDVVPWICSGGKGGDRLVDVLNDLRR